MLIKFNMNMCINHGISLIWISFMFSEHCRRLPAMFSPVHELSHQIQILNAYMRESELMRDGLHPTLWAVLDEMIDLYQRLEPQSLFGGLFIDRCEKRDYAHMCVCIYYMCSYGLMMLLLDISHPSEAKFL